MRINIGEQYDGTTETLDVSDCLDSVAIRVGNAAKWWVATMSPEQADKLANLLKQYAEVARTAPPVDYISLDNIRQVIPNA